MIYVCWYILKALKYPNLFSGVNSKTKLINDLIEENKEVKLLTTNKEVKSLISYMKSKKPYLNPSLSIRNLSEEVKMNSRDLSILINQNLNQHFFDFINKYRIIEAMNILKNPAKKELTVLEILYEVGFNSKSSFNTGFTSTQFKKKELHLSS